MGKEGKVRKEIDGYFGIPPELLTKIAANDLAISMKQKQMILLKNAIKGGDKHAE